MPEHLLVFVGVVTLLTITLGADMAMVARSVLIGGRRAAFATTLGSSAGCFVWACTSDARGWRRIAIFYSMLLASVHIAIGIGWLSLYSWLLDRAVEAFKGSRVRAALDALTGTVLVALGVRLAVRRD